VAVVRVTLTRDGHAGHGECVPYQRYGETPDGVLAAIMGLQSAIAGGLDRGGLQAALPPGAARNGLDCAMWDLESRQSGRSVADLAGLRPPSAVTTAYTISLDTPEAMADAARRAGGYPLLKLKLGGAGDAARLEAVRAVVPRVRLLVDANEAWSPDTLDANLDACQRHGVELVEQPLPANDDAALARRTRTVPVCADESAHALDGLEALAGRYDAINIKLDKTGGLTHAIALAEAAKARGMKIMVGCMLGTSLSMAPALLLAGFADWIDLDGPLLLERDRPGGLAYDAGRISGQPALWGTGRN
jgi:L-alanine-DL-glutamate epimerase-like enolase superfamily enzyme